MPNLERLDLQACKSLEEVHPSLGHCRMLTYLSLRGCCKLEKLPKFVCMEYLETLDLLECTSLQEFPEICGDMHRLSELCVGSPWIRSLTPSLGGLRDLQLIHCEILESIPDTFRNLRDLIISGCNKLVTLANSLFELQQLENLTIFECSGLVKLPISFGVQNKLSRLHIMRCENLKKLPSSIQIESLEELTISECPNLDTFPEIKGEMHWLNELALDSTGMREAPSFIWRLTALKYLSLEGNEDLVSLPDSLCNLMNLGQLFLRGCKKLEKLPENIGDLQKLWELNVSDTAISQPFQHSSSFVWERLNVSGSNISCLPKSINKLSRLYYLNIQFCRDLNELPGELLPNLKELFADYHLALKSIRDLVICCLKLRRLSISDYGSVSSEQVNEFLEHFRWTCIQYCDFNQRDSFAISFPGVKIPELFDYQFINQKEISVDLNPSWYTNKFMGFWISYAPSALSAKLVATLVSKSDPERKHSLEYSNFFSCPTFPSICCIYLPFERLWSASGNKQGKNPNDYYMLELSQRDPDDDIQVCWGISLEYKKEAMSDIGHQKKRRKK